MIDYNLIYKIKESSPLIHHITNYVTVNDCANITLAIGGSPLMATCASEAEDITSASDALVINIGTIKSNEIESMILSGKTAKKLNKPVVFDPVGCGASQFRGDIARQILDAVHPDIIKGNMSEINHLLDCQYHMRGVDSTLSMDNASDAAKLLSQKTGAVVIITGKTDYVSNGHNTAVIFNGTPMMSKITGTGCMLNSIIGCCAAVCSDYFAASAYAAMTVGICGETAQNNLLDGEGTGSFRQRFIDAMSLIDDSIIKTKGVIHFE